jgi:hypothetical protein
MPCLCNYIAVLKCWCYFATVFATCNVLTRLCMMVKSREHQELNLQREYQGKNEELTRMLLETQIELASQVSCHV